MKRTKRRSVADRFWKKVDKNGKNGCWNWIAYRNRLGYGQFFPATGIPMRAHRWSFETSNGTIPRGMWVLHKCDNPPCVNPAHLFLGTAKDNNDDMMRKGRHRYVQLQARNGMRNPASQLSELAVQRIRIIGNALSAQRLANLYGVSKQTISRIWSRSRWAHLQSNRASF